MPTTKIVPLDQPSIDDGSRGNADLRRDLSAPVIAAGGFTGTEERGLPKLRSRVGIKCVNAIVFGDGIDHIARLAAD
jgi:hypothetical protein